MSKAQLSSMELIAGVFVFIIMVVFLFSVFASYSSKLGNSLKDNDRQRLALQVTDSLVKTKGVPEDWEATSLNTSEIGLIERDRVLKQSKLDALEGINYNSLRSIMNIQKYDFNLTIKFADGTIITSVGIPISGKKVSTIRRFAEYQEKDAIIDFALFNKEQDE